MKIIGMLGSAALVVVLSLPAAAQGPMGPPAREHSDEWGHRGELSRWAPPHDRWRGGPDAAMRGHRAKRHGPISMMLVHRTALGLSASQVESLERLRGDFARDAIRRDADLRIAHLDLRGLLRPDPNDPNKAADMAKVEGKVREIEKMWADLRLARIRTVEAGRAQLTPEQRTRLAALVTDMRRHHEHHEHHAPRGPMGPRGPQPPPMPRS